MVALLTGYRFAPATPEFSEQKKYLVLTLALLQHTPTKHYLLQNVLYPFKIYFINVLIHLTDSFFQIKYFIL